MAANKVSRECIRIANLGSKAELGTTDISADQSTSVDLQPLGTCSNFVYCTLVVVNLGVGQDTGDIPTEGSRADIPPGNESDMASA